MYKYDRYRNNAQRIRQLVSPVRVTDIMVAPQGPKSTGGNYLGEFGIDVDNIHSSSHDLIKRIGDHIELCAQMANKEHEKANFQDNSGTKDIKPGHENEVTRLGFNEFSFYPKDRPLTLDEYHILLNRIRDIAENCHQNLHLVLASFPVIWPDNKVYNIVVHAQCGTQAELYPFAKSVPSSIDAIYPQTTNPSFIGSSYYPKVLSEGIESTTANDVFTFEETINFITHQANENNPLGNRIEATSALNDLKDALIADKYCPPSQELLTCIDDSIDAINRNTELTVDEVAKLKKLTSQFKDKAIEESDRFRDAASLTLPKPSIITNGLATQHYGRFSFQQVIDEILSAKDDSSKNAKALEILVATKSYIEQSLIDNSTYTVSPQLTYHIDNMIAKLNSGTQNLNNLDVTTFKNRMNNYNKSCQQIYRQHSLEKQRPGIFKGGIKLSPPLKFRAYDAIAETVRLNSNAIHYLKAEDVLERVKHNIKTNNKNNPVYAPYSAALLAHINHMLLSYKPSFSPLDPNEFNILATELKNYKDNCETHYSNYVRSIMPQISAQIGKTASYGKAFTLTEMADLIKTTLDDPKQRNVSREQFNYIRDNLLFSKQEKSKGTKHTLLQKIDQISEKFNKLDIAEQLQQHYDNFKTIETTLKKSPLDKDDFIKINQCIIALESVLAGIKKDFPNEDTTAIKQKITDLINSLPINPESDPEMYKDVTVQVKDLATFKEGFDDLGVLLTKIQNDHAITSTDSNEMKSAVENYKSENLADKIENVIKIINLLKEKDKDYQTQATQLTRIFDYLKSMETLSPDSKKALTAITDKLNKNEKIEDDLIQNLKDKLNLENGITVNMPYWYFPSQSYSENITYDSTVPCRTPLSEFWFNVHICLDHLYATGYRSYLANIARDDMPPGRFDEMVSSNSVGLEKAHTTDPQGIVSHTDVKSYKYVTSTTTGSKISSEKLNDTLMGTRNLSTEKTLDVKLLWESSSVTPKDSSYKTNISLNPKQLIIEKPPFGPPIVMRKFEPHALLPLPLTNGSTASVDTYTTNYYIRSLDAILSAFTLPPGAIKQQEYLKDFTKRLAGLKNNHTATASNFYQLLEDLEQKVKSIPPHDQPNGEDNTIFLQQIGLMQNYLDTKMLSLESYVMLRILEPLGNALPVKQNDVVTRFSNALDNIQQTAVNDIPFNDLAKAVIDFRKEILALSSEPDNLDALKKSCQETENYLRERYPEVHDEMVNLYFPEFTKIIKLVDPLGTGLSEKQLSALNKLKEEIKVIQKQSLQFDDQGRPILNPYDIENAIAEFKSNVSKIDSEDVTTLTNLGQNIDVHIGVIKNNFEALNLGKEYFETQAAMLAEQKKKVQSEINALENNKKSASLDGKNKWQYRDEKTESLENDILKHLNTFLMTNELLETDPHRMAVSQLIEQLNYIKKATGNKTGKSVVMTSELVNSLIKLQNMLVVYPMPSLNETYQEMIKDLQSKYPQIYAELNNTMARQKFVQRHQILQEYHSELKDQITVARKKKERVKAIDDELPKAKEEFELKKEGHEKLLLELGKSQNELERVLEELKQITIQQRSLNEKHGSLLEEGRALTSKFDVQIKLNQQLSIKYQELIQTRKSLVHDKDIVTQNRSNLISETKEIKKTLGTIDVKLSEISEQHNKLSETIEHNKLLHQQLLQSSALLESQSTVLNGKLPDLGRRCEEMGKILENDKKMLLDKINRLNALGKINENNKGEAENLQKSIQDYEKRIVINQAEYDKLNNRLIETHQQIQQQIEKCKSELQEAEMLKQNTIIQLQELKNLQTMQEKYTSEKSELTSKLHSQEEELLVFDIKMSAADELISKKTLEISSMEITLNNQDRAIEEIKDKIKTNAEETQEMSKEIEKCENTMESLQERELKQQQVVKEKTELVDLSKEANTKLEEQVNSLTEEKATLESELNAEGQTLEDLSTRMNTIDTQYRALDSQKEHHDNQQSNLSERISLSERAKQRLQEKENNMVENVKRLTK